MPRKLITPDLTLYRALKKVVARYPERPALTYGDETVTYRELAEEVDGLARGLRSLGVGAGDKVAIILPNSLELVYSFFAPSALGAAIVPLNPLHREREFRHILADAEVSVVIAEPNHRGNDIEGILRALRPSLPNLEHVVVRGDAPSDFTSLGDLEGDSSPLPSESVSPDDLCALVYTSGTTGMPKAVMHSHGSMLSAVVQGEARINAPILRKVWNLLKLVVKYDTRYFRWGFKQGTYMAPSPMHALLGYAGLVYGLLLGHRVVIADGFHPARVLELVEREHVTALSLTPTMVAAVLNSPEMERRDLSSLLYVAMGAAPCPPDLVRRARKAFGCPIVIAFGATEVGGVTLMTDVVGDSEELQSTTVGRLVSGMEAKVVDDQRREMELGEVGELALRLPSTMMGYYKAAETTAQALDDEGWYYTGDLATLDDRGYVRIVGRKKNMIIRGGQNIYPAEIENHLMSHPDIENVAVIGVPDRLAGERVWAFLVPREGGALTPGDVLRYAREGLAPYKVPDQVRIVDDLPLTSTNKVRKFALLEMIREEGVPL
jgi:acyl-CoA synthetase (AMP-forming)/AMP-acid ligase II